MVLLVRRRMGELGLKNVDLLERITSREEVARTMMDVDVLLLPLSGMENIEKGISSKLYEYQAAGKPVICCSSGQSGHYVSESGSGIVVRPGDHESLAKSIVYLKGNRGLAQELGDNGRRYVERNLSIEKIGSKMKRIFEALV